MTASELCDLLARDLARQHGGAAGKWRRAVGRVALYARETHPHCNWEVKPAGTPSENELVERAADRVRTAHPFLAEG